MAGFARRLGVQDISFEIVDLSDNTSVASGGGDDTQNLQPASGYIYEVIGFYYKAPDPTGSTSGSHKIYVRSSLDSEMSFLSGASNSGADLLYKNNVWTSADNFQVPSTEDAQVNSIRNLMCDHSNYLELYYKNATDANQTASRDSYFLVKKIRVA